MKSKLIKRSVIYHIFASALALLMIYPLLWLVMSSFKSNATMFSDTYSLIPKEWAILENYSSGWAGISGVSFLKFLLNSLFVTLVATATGVISSLLAAYAFSRIKFKFSDFWFGCLMVTMMLPSQVMIVPQYIIFKKLNLIDTTAALILPWAFGGAFYIFLMVQFFRGIPKELDEAAEIDGCGKMGVLFRILVPIVKPAIITSSIFSFYWCWQDFFQPLVFMSDISKFTVPLALNLYLDPNAFNNYGGLFAMSVISLIPIILFFLFFQKYLVQGIVTEGLKG